MNLSLDQSELIAQVIEAAPNGVVLTDAAGTIMLVNRELERMFGYPRAQLIGSPVEILLPERHRQAHCGQRGGYLADPTRRAMGAGRELFARRADGSEFPVEIGLSGIRHGGGTFALAAVVDITARLQEEASMRRIIDGSPSGLIMVDAAGTIVLVNKRLCMLLGYTEEELLGKQMEMLLPQRYRAEHVTHRASYTRAPSLRAMGANRDLTALHKDGTEFPVEVGLSPIRWRGADVSLAVMIDISTRKRLELELREANAHLEEFTYVASHDLRSPLRGISDLVDWLCDDLKDVDAPGVHRNLERVRSRIKKLERILADLLTYARGRDASSEAIVTSLEDIMANVLELESPPPGMKVNLDLQCAPFKTPRTPLETTLRNLISNAIKHHDLPDGTITITAREEKAYCHIAIEDDGPGIPEKSHARVFKLFQTVSSSERRGSGLGLALSKRLVESHGGRLELASKDGERGATFHVWWPRFERRVAELGML